VELVLKLVEVNIRPWDDYILQDGEDKSLRGIQALASTLNCALFSSFSRSGKEAASGTRFYIASG
jgi:hypothetical protein